MAQVITVAQQKGGAGKTTLASNLAAGFAGEGRRVAVLDCDPQGSLGRWFLERAEGDRPEMELSTASAWGAGWEVKKLARTHDVIVIDTPPKLDGDLRPAIKAADLVVVPVGASLADVWAVEGVLDLCRREKRLALAVIVRATAGTRVLAQVREALTGLDVEVAGTVLGHRVAYAEALGSGGAVEDRRGPAAAEMAALRAEVAGRLGGG